MKAKEHQIFIALLIIMLIFLVYYIAMLTYPYKTLEFKTPVPVVNKEVKAGEILYIDLYYCKFVDTPTILSKRFVNDMIIALPLTTANAKKGCTSTLVPVEVPKFLEPGDYTLEMSATNRVNPFREITIYYNTEQFNITE